jgi:hypothetical protein
VERVVEYLDLPQEPQTVIESRRPPAYWPSSSKNDAMLVVKDLIVKCARFAPRSTGYIVPAENRGPRRADRENRHGYVGVREGSILIHVAGSGKSTLAMSILRFVRAMFSYK